MGGASSGVRRRGTEARGPGAARVLTTVHRPGADPTPSRAAPGCATGGASGRRDARDDGDRRRARSRSGSVREIRRICRWRFPAPCNTFISNNSTAPLPSPRSARPADDHESPARLSRVPTRPREKMPHRSTPCHRMPSAGAAASEDGPHAHDERLAPPPGIHGCPDGVDGTRPACTSSTSTCGAVLMPEISRAADPKRPAWSGTRRAMTPIPRARAGFPSNDPVAVRQTGPALRCASSQGMPCPQVTSRPSADGR